MSKKDDSPPNVIWIFGDQHPGYALSLNKDPNVTTPNIDRLGLMGVNFTNAVAGYPLCCPFRGSLLTGKYPHKCVPGHEYPLDLEERTIADVFNDNGYKTVFVGKWHLDGFPEWLGRATKYVTDPDGRGNFQTWIGYENNNSQWDTWVHGHDDGEEIKPYRLPGYETDELTNILIEQIKKIKDYQDETGKKQPFFAVLSVQPPHNPYVAPERFMSNHNPQKVILRENVPPYHEIQQQARQELAGMYAMIENLDWNVGRIMNTLHECDLAFNTHVMFFSDHGDMHGSHGQFKKTLPYHESLGIPFVIGGEKPMGYEGRGVGEIKQVINHVDIAPTTLGLCGIPKPD
ncbi:MAG: sulfatase family protein [Promethearchaeota archaeon]